MAMQPKVLRVGIIQGGKILEERLFKARQPISVGSSPRSTIVLPIEDFPKSLPLFQVQGDQYVLSFTADMEGRIQGAQGAVDFGALVSQGLARKQGDQYVLPLRDDQRGKVVVRDITVLFQFVAPPPEAPRATLPEAVRGNHFRTLDRLFVTVLLCSVGLHFGAYVAMASTPTRQEITLEEMPERFARLVMPEKKPEPRKPSEVKKPEQVAAPEKKPDSDQPKKPAAEAPTQTAADRAAHAAAVAKSVQSKGILRVLGSLGGSGGTGAVADVLGQGGGFGDVASALSGAGGVAVASDPGVGNGRKGGGQGGAARIGDLGTSGGAGGKVNYGTKSEARVSGSVAAEVAEVESSDIDQTKLGSFVRLRISSLKACYENQLKRNPNLHGKIRIEFTILETGGLSDLKILENSIGSPEVASCIVSLMRAWRTPFHPSGPVTVVYPFLFSAQ
jgi:TonB family protein